MCVAPKAGCTLWMNFVLYVNEHRHMLDRPDLLWAENENSHVLFGRWGMCGRHFGAHASCDRVILVRNPYVRFLSSYLDWRARESPARANASFALFTDEYAASLDAPRGGLHHRGGLLRGLHPSHVRPIAHVCMYRELAFGAVLRLEQMPLWYASFLRRYDLERFHRRLAAEGHPFYRPHVTEATRISERLGELLGRRPWEATAHPATRHATGAARLVTRHYTPPLARRVFDLQRVDFEAFGYPAWDGDPARFSLV